MRGNPRHSKALYKAEGWTYLERLLKRKKITKTDTARILGISQTHVHRICNDYVNHLSINNLYKLAGILGVNPGVLLYCLERSRDITEEEREEIEEKKHAIIEELDK